MNHSASAQKYFVQKYHCSQAVFAAFATELGITEEQALKISGCFGSGMRKGEVCGAVTGALMALGLKYGQCRIDDTDSRIKTNELTDLLMDRFKEKNGSYICKYLLGHDITIPAELEQVRGKGLFTSLCPKMVASAATILDEIIEEEEEEKTKK